MIFLLYVVIVWSFCNFCLSRLRFYFRMYCFEKVVIEVLDVDKSYSGC